MSKEKKGSNVVKATLSSIFNRKYQDALGIDLANKEKSDNNSQNIDIETPSLKDLLHIPGVHAIKLDRSYAEISLYDKSMFDLLDDEQRIRILVQLDNTILALFQAYLFKVQASEKDEDAKRLLAKMNHCYFLIKSLCAYSDDIDLENKIKKKELQQLEKKNKESGLDQQHKRTVLSNTNDYPVRYLGLRMGEDIANLIQDFIPESAISLANTNDLLTKINMRRLHDIGSRGVTGSVLKFLPDTFAPKAHADKTLDNFSTGTGYLSFILYFVRFGVNLGLLLKHTIRGPWMSGEEKEATKHISWTERLSTQWDNYKYILINDGLWSLVNMACYFWLKGDGKLGHTGNFVTVAFLGMDLYVAIRMFKEAQDQYLKHLEQMEKAFNQLLNQTANNEDEENYVKISLLSELETKKAIEKRIRALKTEGKIKSEQEAQQLLDLVLAYRKAQFEWEHQRHGLRTQIAYCIGTIAAVSVLSIAALLPKTAVMAKMATGIVGAGLYLAINIAITLTTGIIGIHKTKAIIQDNQNEINALIQKLEKTYRAEETGKTENPDWMIQFVKLEALLTENEYQKRMKRYQTGMMIYQLVVDLIYPAAAFATMLFLPMGIGIAVMAGAMILTALINLIAKQFEPQKGAKDEQRAGIDKSQNLADRYQTFFKNYESEKKRLLKDNVLFEMPINDSDSEDSDKNDKGNVIYIEN